MTLIGTIAIDNLADTAPDSDQDGPIGVAEMGLALDALPCPTCDGQGEVLVSGDPRGPNFITRSCWDCKEEGTVSIAVWDEIVRMGAPEWEGP